MADFTTNYGWAIEIEYNENYYAQAVALREAIDTTVKSVEDKADANTAALATHKANGDTDILHVTADEKASITHAEYIWQTAIQELTATESDVPGANVNPNPCFCDWTSSDVPDGWTQSGTHNAANYVEDAGSGGGVRCVSDGTVSCSIALLGSVTAGDSVRISYTVSDVTLGKWYIFGITDLVEFDTVGSFTVDTEATTTFVSIARVSGVAGDISLSNFTVRPLEEVANTDKKLDVIVRENGFLQSEDLSTSWANSEITPLATSVQSPISGVRYYGQVGASGTAFKYSAQSYMLPSAGRITVGAFMKEGDLDWSKIRNSSNSQETYFNVATGDKGSSASTNRYRHIDHGDYGRLVMVELDGVAGANDLRYYPCNADNNGQSTGDGSTVNMHITGMRVRAGTIEEFISYIKTTTAAYPRTQLVEIQTDPALKHAAGFVLTADGAWVPTSTVNGLLMDESPPNVAALRQAGLYKAVESGAWGPMVAGITFWANDDSGEYYELFEGTATGCPEILTPSLTAPDTGDAGTEFVPAVEHQKGKIWKSGYVINVPSFTGRNLDLDFFDFAAVETTPTGMELVQHIYYGSSPEYRVIIQWTWLEV